MDEEDINIEMELEITNNNNNNNIPIFNIHDFDFDYEFDAARFFDFTRPESEPEARLSESWFDSAPNYPPSPFVAKLFQMEGLYSQNGNGVPICKYDDSMSLADDNNDDDDDMNYYGQYSYQDEPYRENRTQVLLNVKGGKLQDSQKQPGFTFGGQSMGLSFYDHMANDMKKVKPKSLAKPFMPRSSTLMKPTASQLAKQKQRQQAIDARFKIGEGVLSSHCGTENQAPKRQKLDGGLLRKIVDLKQPTNLAHKMPKKDVASQGTNFQRRLRITIPREPDLETAHRAERIRSTSNKERENHTSTVGRFKARPFNKKIFEAPVCPNPKNSTPHVQDFQTFRFRTTERTKQPASAPTTIHCQTTKGLNKGNPASKLEPLNKDGNRFGSVDDPKLGESQFAHSFKARPLDRKILTSRGDLGVFRNSKREVTVPKEFELQTAKRNHQNPPVDLFSKLSLAGESQLKNCAQPQLPRTSILPKGLKENRWESCQQDQNLNLQMRETQDNHRGKHIFTTTSVGISEFAAGNVMSRAAPTWRQ